MTCDFCTAQMVVLLNASPFSQTVLRATSLTFQISCPAVSSQKRRSFFLFSISGQNGTDSLGYITFHPARRREVAADRSCTKASHPPLPAASTSGKAEPRPQGAAPRGCSPALNTPCAAPSGLRVWSPGTSQGLRRPPAPTRDVPQAGRRRAGPQRLPGDTRGLRQGRPPGAAPKAGSRLASEPGRSRSFSTW